MLKESISPEEKEAASDLLEKYRKKYMCNAGPVIHDAITNAMTSESGKKFLKEAVEQFLNSTYFKDTENSGLPLNSRQILGFEVWQSPCLITGIKPCGNGSFLTALYNAIVNVRLKMDNDDLSNIDTDFFKIEKKEGGFYDFTYHYTVESLCSSLEQTFLFCRAFWYYIEAAVLFHLIDKRANSSSIQPMAHYLELRKSLILPFVHVNFPESHFYAKISPRDEADLSAFFDKYFFSRYKKIQQQALLIAQVIANGTSKPS